jgi:hypothetical protein
LSYLRLISIDIGSGTGGKRSFLRGGGFTLVGLSGTNSFNYPFVGGLGLNGGLTSGAPGS